MRLLRVFIVCIAIAGVAFGENQQSIIDRAANSALASRIVLLKWNSAGAITKIVCSSRLKLIFPFCRRQLCAGLLLADNQWVLTAASCFTQRTQQSPHLWGAKIGSFEIDSPIIKIGNGNLIKTHYHRDISQIIIHPDNDQYENDIALVRLSSPVEEIDESPLKFSTSATGTHSADLQCAAVLFGCTTEENQRTYGTVKQLNAPMNVSRCSQLVGKKQTDETKYFCVSQEGHDLRYCSSPTDNYGAPLVCGQGHRSLQLFGILSSSTHPIRFTKTGLYDSWIRSIAGPDYQ